MTFPANPNSGKMATSMKMSQKSINYYFKYHTQSYANVLWSLQDVRFEVSFRSKRFRINLVKPSIGKTIY